MRKLGFKNLMVFIILSATVGIAYQLPYLRFTFYDQMAAALQLTNAQIGDTSSAVAFVSTLSYPIGGYLASRFSTRKLIIITLIAHVAITVWFAFTTSYIAIMIIHVLYGFFGIATLWSAYLNGIRNLGDKDNQSTLFGSSEATRGIVQTVLGFIFLGITGAAASDAIGFRNLLLAASAITAVVLVGAVIFLPKDPDVKTDGGTNDAKFSIMDVLKNKGVWITIFLIMGAFMTWSLGNGYLTTYTVQVLEISSKLASTIGIIRSYIIVFLAGFIGGFVLDKFTYKGKGMLILLTAVIVAVLGVMLTSKVVPICIGLTLLIAFIANILKSTYWSVMDQAGIPLAMTPVATGIISFIAFIPDFIVGPVCGRWLDSAQADGNITSGFIKIFILMIAFAVVGIISSLLLVKRTKELEASA